MERILVDTVEMLDCSCRIAKISEQLDNISNDLSGLHMSRKGGAYLTIDGVTVQSFISKNRRNLDKLSIDTRKLSKAVNQASADFQNAENDLLHLMQMMAWLLESNGSIYLYGLIDALKYPRDTSLWSSTMRDKYYETLQNTTLMKDSKGRDIYINYDEGQQMMLAGFSLSAVSRRSLFQRDAKYESGLFSAEGAVRVGNADANASVRGGLFITKIGPDGKERYVFSLGVEAKAGASVSVFEAFGRTRFGNDLNNIMVEGEAKALSGEAKGEFILGLVDGKFAAKAGGSLEANLVSATASGSVSVAGVEAKGSVTGKVGVGAQMNLGYNDGVFSGDIGASLGLGMSVKFEVDVGKAVSSVGKPIVNKAKAIWPF